MAAVTANTLHCASEAYATHRHNIVAIILDGCVPGSSPNTGPFIEQVANDIKSGDYKGVLVAASSLRSYRNLMMEWGCTHQATKDDAAAFVLALLSQSP